MVMVIRRRSGASPWAPDENDFPYDGTVESALRFCVGYAMMAPSSHNAQPWWFRVAGNTITVGLDVSRGLAVVDPDDREGLMSVGAATLTLRVALAHFGLAVHAERWPDPTDPESCVRLTARYGDPVDPTITPLFEAIPRRRTSRARFARTSIAPSLLEALVAEVTAVKVSASVFADATDREEIAALVTSADRLQMADPRFRRELASWLRRPGSRQRDGIHGFSITSPLAEVALAHPLVVRTFIGGDLKGAHDHDLVEGTPVMICISTEDDSRDAWICAGAALARLQLRACLLGLSVGFLDQVIEVPGTRVALQQRLANHAVPQLLLRVGFGPEVAPQPRRALVRALVD
jgi:hypothetical protein